MNERPHPAHRGRARRPDPPARPPPSRWRRRTSTGSRKVDDRIHAYLHVDADGALSRPRARSTRARRGRAARPARRAYRSRSRTSSTQKGVPTTCGSKILEGWRPPYDSTVVRRLRDAGVVILGKTNMDEFAMGSSTENSAYGPTRNPWDLDRIPGGSGGGSSASRRRVRSTARDRHRHRRLDPPARIGHRHRRASSRPTAASSRYGLVALASSLDQAGPCARTVLDAALLHEVDRRPRPDATPPRSTSRSRPWSRRPAPPTSAGMRVGVVRELGGEGYQPGVEQRFREAVDLLDRARCRGRRGLLPELRLRARGLLPDPAERVLAQPRPLRRDALRPAGRRRRRRAAPRRSWRRPARPASAPR